MEALIAMRDVAKAKFDEVRASTRAKWKERERGEGRIRRLETDRVVDATRTMDVARADAETRARVRDVVHLSNDRCGDSIVLLETAGAGGEEEGGGVRDGGGVRRGVGRGQGGEAAGGGGFHGDVVWTVSESGADLRGHV